MADRSLRERLKDAVATFQRTEKPPQQNELAWADPMRLLPETQFTPLNPDVMITRKGMGVIDIMRDDDQIKAAMTFKKHAVMATGWTVESPEDQADDWEPRNFVEDQLRNLPGTLENKLLEILTAMDYGFSVSEKLFGEITEGEFRGKIGIHNIKTKKPHYFGFRQDKFGNVEKLTQARTPMGLPELELPMDKFVIYAYQKEFQNPYGNSDLRAAYRYWWYKDAALKWLMMLLERFGIPPLFGLYDPNEVTGKTLDDLKTIFKRMQAATNVLIPALNGPDGEAFKLEFPEVTQNIQNAFEPTLKLYDLAIARALLMPGLLGLSPEQITGSLARAQKSFDMFLFIVEKIRMDVQEQIMHDQIVKPLVDLNYTVDEYPKFKLLPLTDDIRTDLLDAWEKQVKVKSVKSTNDDEAHIRAMLDFPEREMDEDKEREPPEGEDDDSDDDDEGLPIDEPAMSFRQQTTFEQRVNFQQIEGFLNESERDTALKLRGEIGKFREKVVKRVRKSGASLEMQKSIERTGFQSAFRRILSEHLLDTLNRGRTEIRREVTGAANMQNDGPNFVPQAATAWLRTRAADKAKALDEEVKGAVKFALAQSVELGEASAKATERLDKAFDPFIGDPRNGPTATTPEGGPLPTRRVENIVRTESTKAFNKGRLVEARQPDIAERMRGFQYSAIIDSRTTPVCQQLDGRIFEAGDPALDRLTPPNHFMCRSVLVPVTIADEVDDRDFISPTQTGRGLELAQEGFT